MPAPTVQLSTASFTPLRNGDRSDVASFSSQVSDEPMAFPKLKIL
jgi:hypothetical protein